MKNDLEYYKIASTHAFSLIVRIFPKLDYKFFKTNHLSTNQNLI